MATSPSDLLDQVNAAITACLTAQSYSVAGRAKQMAQLGQLQAFRVQLLNEIQASNESSGGMCSLGQIASTSL
jgi:hypothetical protein